MSALDEESYTGPVPSHLKIKVSSNERSEIDMEDMEKCYIPIGDIVAEGKDCVIERKQVDDFISSCSSPHMWNQVKDMKNNYKRQVVIIVGHFPDDVSYRNKKHIPHAYKSIANLIKRGVTVLNVKNDAMLSTLSKAILQEAEPRDPTIPIKRVQKSGKHSVIRATADGIGDKKAKALLEKFKSVNAIANATIEELSEVKGINRILAEKIHISLN